MTPSHIRQLTAQVVSGYVGRNNLPPAMLSEIIGTVHNTLRDLNQPTVEASPRPAPAVPISRSVQQDYIVCLEDGAKLKMLRRYLRSRYGMTPEQYRARWGLPADYPMTAPIYSKRRSDLAKASGLGTATRGKR